MRRRERAANRHRGQTLVEFSLIFPTFVLLIVGIIEFTFIFNAILGVNFAARDAALAAAEAGDTAGADCVILRAVDDAIGPPAADNRIVRVEIYKANANGAQIGSATVYARGGTKSCLIDGVSFSVPYSQSANGYPEGPVAATGRRCNLLGGCPTTGSTTVDNIGVRIVYTHTWVTPLRNFIGGGPSGGTTFDRSSVMRMEPVL